MKAFPHMAHIHQSLNNTITKEEIISGGMELRDYFAAKVVIRGAFTFSTNKYDEETAKRAYEIADALMKAREL